MTIEDCDFCAIIRGELTARIVHETEHTLAFFPVHPAARGHTLVIPKTHIADFWSIDEVNAGHLSCAAMQVGHGLRRALNPQGLNIIQSSGAAATQTVFHLHIHMVPRWVGDHVGDLWPPSEQWSEIVEDQVAEAVREACSADHENRASATTAVTPTTQIDP